MKKGFTLAELLGVTIILALVVTISYPVILNIFEQKELEIDSNKKILIETAAINYAKKNINEYPYKENTSNCIFVKELIDNKEIPYEVDDELLYRIVEVKMGINEKYNAELLDNGAICSSRNIDYEVKTCINNLSTHRYELKDTRIGYYINNVLIKRIDIINGKDISSINQFAVEVDNYNNLSNALKGHDGISLFMNKGDKYFKMHVEFDMSKFDGFTDIEKQYLINAPIFYNSNTASLDDICS